MRKNGRKNTLDQQKHLIYGSFQHRGGKSEFHCLIYDHLSITNIEHIQCVCQEYFRFKIEKSFKKNGSSKKQTNKQIDFNFN